MLTNLKKVRFDFQLHLFVLAPFTSEPKQNGFPFELLNTFLEALFLLFKIASEF